MKSRAKRLGWDQREGLVTENDILDPPAWMDEGLDEWIEGELTTIAVPASKMFAAHKVYLIEGEPVDPTTILGPDGKAFDPDQPRDPETGQWSSTPSGGSGEEPPAGLTGSAQLHAQADTLAQSWLDRAKELPGKAKDYIVAKVKAKYTQLESRYGKPMAIGIMAAGIVGTAMPIPGATIMASAPMIGVAEVYRLYKGGKKDAEPDVAKGVVDDKRLHEIAAEWCKQLRDEWEQEKEEALKE